MTDVGFVRIITQAYVPFLEPLGFRLEKPVISGRFYAVEFTGSSFAISVSYEPGDEALFVFVFTRRDGQLSNIDDPLQTPRLTHLNKRYMHTVTPEEYARAEREFGSVLATDEMERQLVKYAKELFLVLPKYLDDRASG